MADQINLEGLKPGEKDAFGLVEAAVAMDQARHDQGSLAAALENNLQLWVALRTAVSKQDGAFPAEVVKNIRSLGDFVTGTILGKGVTLSEQTLTTLVNINLQICEGLLEGAKKA